MHVQVLVLVAGLVAREQHHEDARDERADEEEPEPRAEELFLQGAEAAGFDGLGRRDGGVDEDGHDAEDLESADDSGEGAEGGGAARSGMILVSAGGFDSKLTGTWALQTGQSW